MFAQPMRMRAFDEAMAKLTAALIKAATGARRPGNWNWQRRSRKGLPREIRGYLTTGANAGRLTRAARRGYLNKITVKPERAMLYLHSHARRRILSNPIAFGVDLGREVPA
ncbi:MAG: hypothetical protein E6G97_25845 [Alphaproteobacteria bacterium]|nr:MAG: hypothetical protein E6G97_25845 [Alphaproteobacteria bacterium]